MSCDSNSIEKDRELVQTLFERELEHSDPISAFAAVREKLSLICQIPWDQLELKVSGDRATVRIRERPAE